MSFGLWIIGDVHAEHELLELAINFLKKRNVDKILCVGDIADGKGNINQCCNLLIQEKIISVKGNHDRWLLQNEMRSLNDLARITPDDYGYSIEVNADLQKIIREQKYQYVINGHTHYKIVRQFYGITIINAGTLKREHEPCFSIVNFVNKNVHFFQFTTNNCIQEIEKIQF